MAEANVIPDVRLLNFSAQKSYTRTARKSTTSSECEPPPLSFPPRSFACTERAGTNFEARPMDSCNVMEFMEFDESNTQRANIRRGKLPGEGIRETRDLNRCCCFYQLLTELQHSSSIPGEAGSFLAQVIDLEQFSSFLLGSVRFEVHS